MRNWENKDLTIEMELDIDKARMISLCRLYNVELVSLSSGPNGFDEFVLEGWEANVYNMYCDHFSPFGSVDGLKRSEVQDEFELNIIDVK